MNAGAATAGSARREPMDHYKKVQAGVLIGQPAYLRIVKYASS
jgi:hypothetical protein